jgi:hypothetical protein
MKVEVLFLRSPSTEPSRRAPRCMVYSAAIVTTVWREVDGAGLRRPVAGLKPVNTVASNPRTSLRCSARDAVVSWLGRRMWRSARQSINPIPLPDGAGPHDRVRSLRSSAFCWVSGDGWPRRVIPSTLRSCGCLGLAKTRSESTSISQESCTPSAHRIRASTPSRNVPGCRAAQRVKRSPNWNGASLYHTALVRHGTRGVRTTIA